MAIGESDHFIGHRDKIQNLNSHIRPKQKQNQLKTKCTRFLLNIHNRNRKQMKSELKEKKESFEKKRSDYRKSEK